MTRRPPTVACADCGRPLGRSWRPYLLCPACRADRAAEAKTHPLRPRPPASAPPPPPAPLRDGIPY